MRLYLKNIGKLSEADVELNGITVIAGENNTGKSTVGKVLFSVFNSYYDVNHQIANERERNVEAALDFMYKNATNKYIRRVDTEEIAKSLIQQANKYSDSPNILKSDILNMIFQYDENFTQRTESELIDQTIDRIMSILNISPKEIFQALLDKRLNIEFSDQICNIYSDTSSLIELTIKSEKISIEIQDNNIINVDNKFSLETEAVYIDDPFVIDDLDNFRMFYRYRDYLDHREHLRYKLYNEGSKSNVLDEIVVSNKLDDVLRKINTICSGDIIRNNRRTLGYRKSNTEKVLSIKNISTGLKTFVILKMLLQNGSIRNNGTVILDEPEIHLHPEWQILFAEIIVLLQKEFNLHILLNTHSPYFLEAIEVYSKKYGIESKCKYYLSENNSNSASIYDITGNTEKIYQKLARPFQDLENERYSDD